MPPAADPNADPTRTRPTAPRSRRRWLWGLLILPVAYLSLAAHDWYMAPFRVHISSPPVETHRTTMKDLAKVARDEGLAACAAGRRDECIEKLHWAEHDDDAYKEDPLVVKALDDAFRSMKEEQEKRGPIDYSKAP